MLWKSETDEVIQKPRVSRKEHVRLSSLHTVPTASRAWDERSDKSLRQIRWCAPDEHDGLLLHARRSYPASGAATRRTGRGGPVSRGLDFDAIIRSEHDRPNPAEGVFETILVLSATPIDLSAHLERLQASVATLAGLSLPGDLEAEAVRVAGAVERSSRLRIDVSWHRDQLFWRVETFPLSSAMVASAQRIDVAPLVVAGGLGAHKWRDRRLIDLCASVPLVIDVDGTVLETGRGSIFASIDGAIATPPADGRILPGITRHRVLRIARSLGIRVGIRSIAIEQLARANEVFATGSIRGIEPVGSCRGVAAWPLGPVSMELAHALWGEWHEEAGVAA